MAETLQQEGYPVFRTTQQRSRPRARLVVLVSCLLLCFIGFIALGSWQVQRLTWKEALIARVEQRIHAAPVEAPHAAQWPSVNAERDEYRHVRISGTYLHELSTKVQATTQLGAGYWLLTPLRMADGHVVLINRGFIPQQGPGSKENLPAVKAAYGVQAGVEEGAVTVTGLLRMSEPEGGFLRKNDAAQSRWYSRDVQAIAAARGLTGVAPYFIDADATGNSLYDRSFDKSNQQPVGGLTVVSFPNSHLVYALTWFALALMTAGAGIWLMREELKPLRTSRHK